MRDKACKTPHVLSDALSKHSINACHSLVFYLFVKHCTNYDSVFGVWDSPTTELVYVVWKIAEVL